MFVSDEVAKVWVVEVRPLSDVMPVVSVIQVPFTAKQPAAKLMPLAKVEEAEPVTANVPVESPPDIVDVPLPFTLSVVPAMIPSTESCAYGVDVPTPTLPFLSMMKAVEVPEAVEVETKKFAKVGVEVPAIERRALGVLDPIPRRAPNELSAF